MSGPGDPYDLPKLVRAATPTAVGIVGAALMAAPLRLAEGHAPTPILPLVAVFFWSLYDPRRLPAAGVFAIGLAQDVLIGGPLGAWAAIYLAVQALALSQRSYFLGRERQVVWLGFAVAAALAGLADWAIVSVFAGAPLPVGPLAVQIAATIALYPVFAALFAAVQRRVAVEV